MAFFYVNCARVPYIVICSFPSCVGDVYWFDWVYAAKDGGVYWHDVLADFVSKVPCVFVGWVVWLSSAVVIAVAV